MLKDAKKILRANIGLLMGEEPTGRKLATALKMPKKATSFVRMLDDVASVGLDNLDEVAGKFLVEPWQLLAPNLGRDTPVQPQKGQLSLDVAQEPTATEDDDVNAKVDQHSFEQIAAHGGGFFMSARFKPTSGCVGNYPYFDKSVPFSVAHMFRIRYINFTRPTKRYHPLKERVNGSSSKHKPHHRPLHGPHRRQAHRVGWLL